MTRIDQIRSGVTSRRRLYPRDALGQALTTPFQRVGRAALTVLGTVLGVSILVTVIGLTSSARAQINRRFASLESTEVRVSDSGVKLSSNGARAALSLTGVVAAGVLDTTFNPQPTVTATGDAVALATEPAGASPPTIGASRGALEVIRARIQGAMFTPLEDTSGAHVALLGVAAAEQLGINDVPTTVYIEGIVFFVQGLIESAGSNAEVLESVVIPDTTAHQLFARSDQVGAETLIVATKAGYATAVAGALPTHVDPVNPNNVSVLTPPSPAGLGQEVSGDVTGLLLVLGGVCLVAGVMGIANMMLVSVLERVREIGLRRAIGARRAQIATQFLLESLALGTLGGVIGTALGLTIVAAVALARDMAPVIPTWTLVAAPAVGALAGLLAGAYPASRAARIEPLAALGR